MEIKEMKLLDWQNLNSDQDIMAELWDVCYLRDVDERTITVSRVLDYIDTAVENLESPDYNPREYTKEPGPLETAGTTLEVLKEIAVQLRKLNKSHKNLMIEV